MGIIDEFVGEVKTCSDTFDNHLSLVDKYMEMASDEYDQKIESADLRYLVESQTSEGALDTLNFLYEEAEEELKQKTGKAMEKSTSTTAGFIADIRTKVNKFTTSITADGNLEKLAAAVALNPFLKKAKAKIVCSQAFKSKAYDQLADTVVKTVMRGGSSKEVKGLEIQFKGLVRRRGEVSVELSLPKMIDELQKCAATMDASIEGIRKDSEKALTAIAAVKITNPDQHRACARAAILTQKIYKQKAADMIGYYVEEMKQLKKSIKNAKKIERNPEPNPESIKESAYEENGSLDQLTDGYLQAIFQDLKEDTERRLQESGIVEEPEDAFIARFTEEFQGLVEEFCEDEDMATFEAALDDLIGKYIN